MKAIRTLLACIRKADQDYNLINRGDKIVVGISGGKDSLTLLYCLHLYQKFSHTDFIIQPVILDLGFPHFDPTKIKEFCHKLGYELIVHDSQEVYKILQIQQKDKAHLPCSICSRMKKAAINKVANELGFNKVSFAHHADDAIETLFINMMYGGRIATFSPKMTLENAQITFIRPLIYVREKDFISFCKEENIPVSLSTCPADKHTTREEVKQTLKELYKKYPSSKQNFLHMLYNYQKEDLWGKELEYQINSNSLVLKPIITPFDEYRYIQFNNMIEIKYSFEEQKYLLFKKSKIIATLSYIRLKDRIFKIKLTHKKYITDCALAVNYLASEIIKSYNPCTLISDITKDDLDLFLKVGFKKERILKRSYIRVKKVN